MQAKKLFDFNERRNAAAEARKAAAEKFQALKARQEDPEFQRKLAEQKAIAESRAQRQAERLAAKKAEEARIAAEKAAEEARIAAERREAERKAAEEAAIARAAEIDARNRARLREAEVKQRALALAAAQRTMRETREAAKKARGK